MEKIEFSVALTTFGNLLAEPINILMKHTMGLAKDETKEMSSECHGPFS